MAEVLPSIAALLISMALILLAAELFTNSVEWLGKKLNLGEGAVGSILAAIGTAMPETIIPIIAILFGGGKAGDEVGIGAILGAPFMLSTVAFALIGITVIIYAARGTRSRSILVNSEILQRDLGYFLVVYTIAVGTAFLPSQTLHMGVAIALLAVYGLYVWQTLQRDSALGGDIPPLHFHRRSESPHAALVIGQFAVALLVMIFGARVFVSNLEAVAYAANISTLVLALLLAPLATELPEKFNSVLWIRRGKDTLALGNVSGAMVFQSCIPVAVGLGFTEWQLEPPAMLSAMLSLTSTAVVYTSLRMFKDLRPTVLLLGGLFYLIFVIYVATLI